jgi:catechol 2,3-dioxygenase-like lactoylglutathione lyase family enzyme
MGGRSFMSVSVRYIVDSVEAALPFYEALGFEVSMRPAPGFAALKKGDLRLLLNEPGAGGAGQGIGNQGPAPGGWNRFQLAVNDLEETVDGLRAKGVVFRNEIVVGKGGRQILAEDPAGNPVELFEPADDVRP